VQAAISRKLSESDRITDGPDELGRAIVVELSVEIFANNKDEK
jgi:hypothetical protein